MRSQITAEIVVRKKKKLEGLEKYSILVIPDQNEVIKKCEKKRWLYLISLPLMWILALWVALKKKISGKRLYINTLLFDGLSIPCRKIKEGAATWHALNIIYNHRFNSDSSINSRVSDFWIGMMNAQAVRNRLRLVKHLLREEVQKFSNDGEVRLLSVACGSAQGVIEIMAEFKQKGIWIRTILLDIDPTAIEYAQGLAKQARVENQITFLRKGVNTLEKVVKGFDPHLVEMVGFLEYRPDYKAIRLVSKIHQILLPGGVFLTSNICKNPEWLFLHWVINWPMIYRTPEELLKIVIDGGFQPQSCQIISEPLKIHRLAICQKIV